MSSSPQPQPPSLLTLTSILTHLLPPSFPLPVDLLSTPLKTRQIYLPPPQDRMLHDGYISLNPGRGRGGTSGSGSSQSERSDETLIDRAKSGLISTLTNGAQTHPHSASPPSKVKETPDDVISLRLQAISSKLLELQNSSVHTVQGENPDSGRWVVDLLGGRGGDVYEQRQADQSMNGDGTWVHYQRPDEETLLARVDLRGLPISVEQDKDKDKDEEKGETEHVEVFLLHEPSSPGSVGIGPDVPAQAQVGQGGEREWKLFDVRLVPSDPSADQASSRSGWVADLSDLPAFHRSGSPGDGDGDGDGDGWGSDVREDDGEGEVGMGGDDFWGGYDDDDDNDDDNNNSADSLTKTGETSGSTNTNTNKQTLPPHLSFPHSSSSGSFSHPAPEPEDDPYWQSYNSVEDGLRPSNPPTPGVRTPGGYNYGTGHGDESEGYYGMTSSSGSGSNARLGGGARTPAREKDYWGTGGETPVGWSPPVREAPLPSMMDDQIDHPDDLAALEANRPVFSHVPNNTIRDRSTTITSAPITATTTTTTADKGPADPAKEARQEHLRSALRALKGMYGGGEGEWDEVVREFAGK